MKRNFESGLWGLLLAIRHAFGSAQGFQNWQDQRTSLPVRVSAWVCYGHVSATRIRRHVRETIRRMLDIS
jgi:hypothetical protein